MSTQSTTPIEIRWRVDYSRSPHHARRLKAALIEHAEKAKAKPRAK